MCCNAGAGKTHHQCCLRIERFARTCFFKQQVVGHRQNLIPLRYSDETFVLHKLLPVMKS